MSAKRAREQDIADDGDNAIFFFGATDKYGKFSNWCFSVFEMVLSNGETHLFYCGEQAIMAEKALIFGDTASFAKIMQVGKYDASLDGFTQTVYTPRYLKQLGRRVAHFDTSTWMTHLHNVAFQMCRAKFSPHCTEFHRLLMSTGSRYLAEASKWDKIWGIGYDANAARRQPRRNWGANHLGRALMATRDSFRVTLVV